MKKKFALCLYGSFASKKSEKNIKNLYDPFETFLSLNKNFIKKNKPDIFFHTWHTRFNSKLIKLYNPKKYKIEKQKKFKVYIENYSLNYIESYNNIQNLLNRNIDPKKEYNDLIFRTHSRWYSQSKSLSLMENYSIVNKIKYDYVVQSRFDLIFNDEIDFSKLHKQKVHLVDAQHIQNKKQLYDIFFVSSAKISILFIKIFKELKNYPIDSTYILPIFFEKNKISYKNSFKFRKIILKRYHDQYLNLNLLRLIVLKVKSLTIRLLTLLIKMLNKIVFFLYKQ